MNQHNIEPIAVLDHGQVRLIDVMGSDESIVENARRSYSDGSKRVSTDRDLIRYLTRHEHGGPFEFAQLIFEIDMPLYIFGHFVRHRTASLNVFSQRYSEVPDRFHRTEPDAWRLQSQDNKQGSAGCLPAETPSSRDDGCDLSLGEIHCHDYLHGVYQARLKAGIAREQARKDLPQSVYTQFRMRIDLRNLFGLLEQRLAPTAQFETRQYTEAIASIVERLFPLSWEAFVDYRLKAMTLSRMEIRALWALVDCRRAYERIDESLYIQTTMTNKRERSEFRAKLMRLGLIAADAAEGVAL